MYNHIEIEKKWQEFWEKNKTFKVENPCSNSLPINEEEQKVKPKYYCLDMFPYPSGAWLHVGHPEWMTANDIVARYKNAKGFNVLHPMWWDAFWLPAENYAIKTWTHPRVTTDKNIDTFRGQIKALGFSYDWDREIDTTDPKYYKWTQWIFLKLFEKGLAYEQDLPINYCPSCKTGLANEEVLNDFTCDRCWTQVEQRKIRQWVLAITKYADRLLHDVDKLDWPEGIKDMQRNWIWKSEWCEFEMKKVDDESKSIRTYTTRIDTVFWMSYVVIAPDHKDVRDYITDDNWIECEEYISKSNSKSDQDRTVDNKEKTWVFTWSYLINPYNWKKISLWIWDYVLGHYGTWAVMAVPAHDIRDHEFAKKYKLEIQQSIKKKWIDIDVLKKAFVEYWELCNSGYFDWLTSQEAKIKLTQYAEEKWFGHITINYKLRDWLFSRQRYWGEPIPLIHLENEDLENIDKIKHKKSKVCYSNKLEGVTHNGDSAKSLLFIISILENICNVKRKLEKKVFLGNLKKEINLDNKKVKFSWYNLWKHFLKKKSIERKYRASFWLTIINNFEKIYFESETIWYLAIKNDIFKIVLEKLGDKKYEVKTYYSTLRYKKLYNKAYIKEKSDGEYLYIKWKQFSKIYDWLYGKIVCDNNLPLELPEVEKYEPSWDGTSPLTKVESFVNIKLAENLYGRRETNTMPQWGWSCWYYLRYMDNLNENELVSKEAVNYWWEVDSYVWWAEHAVLHLLYARFWHKFLFDIWVVPTNEPFYRLRNQWMILAHAFQRKNGWLLANDLVKEKDWEFIEIETWEVVKRIISKMSKSLKNVINPDDIVKEYWADSLRLYEMYMAEFKDTAPWDTKGIVWVRRFLDKVDRLFDKDPKISLESDEFTKKLLHKTIKKVGEDIENYKFNTAIASMIILVNNWLPKKEKNQIVWKKTFLILLHPFAPHLAEELWEKQWWFQSIFFAEWPEYDEKLVVDDIIVIWVQVLWKLRWEIEILKDEDKESVLEKAKNQESVIKWIDWKEIVKEIYVPWKIVNLVVK